MSRVWWREPFRMFQTNLREVDAGLDVERVLDYLEEFGANAWLISVGGILSNYPTGLDFQTRNPHLAERPSGDLGHEHGAGDQHPEDDLGGLHRGVEVQDHAVTGLDPAGPEDTGDAHSGVLYLTERHLLGRVEPPAQHGHGVGVA